MSQYDNTNRGAMWNNANKQSDNHPDLSGSINIEGVEYWISGWKRRSDSSPNAPVVSLSIRPKDQQSAPKPQPAPVQQAPADFEDDIPW